MRPAGVGSNGLTADDPDFREMERDGPAHLWHAQAAVAVVLHVGQPPSSGAQADSGSVAGHHQRPPQGPPLREDDEDVLRQGPCLQSVRKNSITLGGMCPSIQMRTLF